MDTITRNRIFMENEDLITRIIKHNYPSLCALRLERDDVYQELAVAALNAINTFDPLRSENIRAHIWMKLQYAILDIKRRYKPYVTSAVGNPGPQVYSIELPEELGYPVAASMHEEEDAVRNHRLRQAMSRLEPREREVVILYLDGVTPKKKAQRNEFNSALEKIRSFYLTAQLMAE